MSVSMDKITGLIEGAITADQLTDEEKEQLYARLFADPDELKAQAKADAIAEIEPQYDIDPVDDFLPAYFMDSDRTITLGRGQHERQIVVRYLTIDDMTMMSAFIPDAWQEISRRGPESLKQAGFGKFLSAVTHNAIKPAAGGKIQRITAAFYKLLAHCLSNPQTEQIVEPGFLRACSTSQIVAAVRAVYEVNQEDFLELWHALPGNIRSAITSYTGTISGPIKNLLNQVLMKNQDSNGSTGTPNGGSTNGSTPSAENMDGHTQKPEALLSESAGDTSKPSKTGSRRKPTSVG